MVHQAPPTGLPVEESIPELRIALANVGHAVLTAPPGSGKTTVVPLRIVDEPWVNGGRITVLEPRRLATRAAARRMAYLIGSQVGDEVGYVTRDDRKIGPNTRIEVITEGVLTRRLQRDPELPGTSAVIFDEFHERNLQTDLGLALALDARQSIRPDLRIVVMSATIDTAVIAELLGTHNEPAPVIESEARMHPVDIRFAPLPKKGRFEDHVASVVRTAVRDEPGDALVFLPGMGEIIRVAERLGDIDADVFRLHGSLPAAEQDAAINPSETGRRKIVLSTDIAETSLTVEGIRIVVDGGRARAPRYDPSHGMTRLQTIQVSRASADQRSGRAGRIEPGVAYRLWSKLEQGARRKHIDPEITQVDLAGLALELAAWGAADPASLSFLDPPPARTFNDAVDLLQQLGALDGDRRLSDLGEAMATLPLHPRLSRMVVDAGRDGWLACIIAALVDDRDVLRGHPDEVPVDLGIRVDLVSGQQDRHPLMNGRGVGRARDTARDLARRAGIATDSVDSDQTGRVLALAFPDRLAMRRGSPGRFQLRTGTTAWMNNNDPLAVEQFVVPADLDGKRKDARIRLAAAIDADDVATLFSGDVATKTAVEWKGDRLVERHERRLGGVVIDSTERKPGPSPVTADAIATRLRDTKLTDLYWSAAAASLAERVRFLRNQLGDPWPDWSTTALSESLDWLGPKLAAALTIGDIQRIDVAAALKRSLPYDLIARLDQLAPTHLTVPSGRTVAVRYDGDTPTVSVKVQEMFGTTTTPIVGGRPVTLELLSPADRPLQITSDLASFWAGAWDQVRKDMAGRYPKHSWPADPASAQPTKRR